MSEQVATDKTCEVPISCLRFGIPDLDVLLRWSSSGEEQPNGLFYASGTTTSLSLVGPDGSGKTLLALHLAARYLHDADLCIAKDPADQGETDKIAESQHQRMDRHHAVSFVPRKSTPVFPRIIYASVDFTLEKAQETWSHFFLNRLHLRDRTLYPYAEWQDDPKLRLIAPTDNPASARLQDLPDEASLVRFVQDDSIDRDNLSIGFLDLQPRTAGDPWNYLRRILNLLKTANRGDTRAMLIVDSTDALFTLSGGIDAYGEQRNRESRVSQLLGAARNAAHLVMLVGASDPDERPAESYLTDGVVRIRVTDESGYQVRSVEIEKVRAQNSVRGRHRFGVRSGEGSSTGRQQNPDDLRYTVRAIGDNGQNRNEPVAHIRLFHSIDFLDSYERAVTDTQRSDGSTEVLPFTGIEYLDSMLPVRDTALGGPGLGEVVGTRNRLQLGTVSAIIGSAKTFKSNIGRAFLARGIFDGVLDYQADAEKMGDWIARVTTKLSEKLATNPEPIPPDEWLKGDFLRRLEKTDYLKLVDELRAATECEKPGFGILLTTDDIRPERLAERLSEWAIPHSPLSWAKGSSRISQILSEEDRIKRRILQDWIESRLICRRLEAHTIYPETLIHIVLRCIFQARKVLGIPGDDTAATRKASGRIRLMIDDWSTICQMYPSIGKDTKCLQFLIREARRLGVTTFIVNSQPLSPGQLLSAGTGANLASEADVVFTTWPVAFRGSRLAAVCVGETARMSEPTIVREIRNRKQSNELVLVDPHLELYRGLLREESEPEPVPLRVCLLGEKHAGADYLSRIGSLFGEMFAAIPGRDRSVVETVISRMDVESSYEQLRALCYFQTGSLDHTLIMLVDEFWGVRSHHPFLSLQDYFTTETECLDKEVRDLRDPHELFRVRLGDARSSQRVEFFERDLFRFPSLPTGFSEDVGESETELETPQDVEPSFPDYSDRNPEKTGIFLDRVPYSWDYAFMAGRIRAWENAQLRQVKGWRWNKDGGGRIAVIVGDVWKALAGEENKLLPLHDKKLKHVDAVAGAHLPDEELRSWRWFLGATAMVAQSDNFFQTRKVIPFDFHSAGPETLGCWILEVWASEILRSIERNEKIGLAEELGPNSTYARQCEAFKAWMSGGASEVATRQGLLEWLGMAAESDNFPGWIPLTGKSKATYSDFLEVGGWAVELYKTLRMLCEFVNEMEWMEQQQPGEFTQHTPSPGAVAVRHYYKTASVAWEKFDHDDPIVPLPLPGRFSTRGDLALTIARGSRSVRLGERSIDKLCSRAGNNIRLETGVGLPVRRMTKFERAALSTRLTAVERFADQASSDGQWYPPFYVRPLRYQELLKTAPRSHGTGDEEWSGYWLWRSRLYGYDSQCVVWQKWLHSTFVEFLRLRRSRGAVWVEGLDAYDQIEQWQCGELRQVADDGEELAGGGAPTSGHTLVEKRSGGTGEAIAPQLTTYKRFGGWCRELIARLKAATPNEDQPRGAR